MARLTHDKYSENILKLVKDSTLLTQTYHQAVALSKGEIDKDDPEINSELLEFLTIIEDREIKHVMLRVVELMRERFRMLNVDVISAVELKREQVISLEEKLIKLSSRRVIIYNIVDPAIIGGLRIIIGDRVIDNSIKTQLLELREDLYKGVYFDNEINAQ